MVESASLTMLKKAAEQSKAVEAELVKEPVVEQAAAEDEYTVDVDTMSSEELDALVKEQGVELPAAWFSMSVEDKRVWLKTQFGEPVDTVATHPDVQTAVSPKAVDEAVAAAATLSPAGLAEAVANTAALNAPEENVSKAKKQKKAKKGESKDVIVAPLTGEVVEADVLADLVHEIENMKEPQAIKMISELMEATEVATFRIGGLLSLVQANGWFAPFATFREFVETKYGIGYRKALVLIEIYTALSNASIPWVKVKDLGWTKLAIIAAVLTPENVEEWVGVADTQNAVTLIETVKSAKAKLKGALTDQTGEPKVVTTMAFKVHGDQKITIESAIDKAKSQSNTEVATVALEFICLDFLGGATLAERMKKAGVENALKALEQAFPSMNFDVSLVDEGETKAA